MQVTDAQRTLREIERVRSETRRDLHPLSYANVVVGLFFLGATVCALVASGRALPIAYWGIGLTVVFVLVGRHEAQRERAIGAEARLGDPSTLVFLGTVGGVALAHALTDGAFGEIAWIYPVAAGWLALAVLYREVSMGVAAGAFLVIGTAFGAAGVHHAGLWAQGAMALLLIATGLLGRTRERA